MSATTRLDKALVDDGYFESPQLQQQQHSRKDTSASLPSSSSSYGSPYVPKLPLKVHSEGHRCERIIATAPRRSIFNKFWRKQERVVPEPQEKQDPSMVEQAKAATGASSSSRPLYVGGATSKGEGAGLKHGFLLSSEGTSPFDSTSCPQRGQQHPQSHSILLEEQEMHAEKALWALERHAPPSDAHWVQQRKDCCVSWMDLLSTPERAMDAQEMLASLPTLPAPMQRFFHEEGYPHALQGAYPIQQTRPKSVLRDSSYKYSNNGGQNKVLAVSAKQDQQTAPLTDLLKKRDEDKSSSETQMRSSASSEGMDTETTGSVSTESGSAHLTTSTSSDRRAVQFDPRVTVTEFDDQIKREWISDEDLERFKYETVFLANSYFHRHPEQIAFYHQARLCPVTGVMRKRPLFSLPVLACIPDNDVMEDSYMDGLKMREISKLEVKRILLADPNKMILDLFEISILKLFPHASITKVQSGEEAIRVWTKAMESLSGNENNLHTKRLQGQTQPIGGFDIVIADQCLENNCMGKPNHIKAARSGSTRDLVKPPVQRSGNSSSFTSGSTSQPSLSNTGESSRMSGSDLFLKISRLETAARACRSAKLRGASNKDKSKSLSLVDDLTERMCLLIGVSANLTKDSKDLLANGADVLWGKPPPSMNDALRDQIVAKLVKKRRHEQ